MIEFFDKSEIDAMSKVSGKPYRQNHPENRKLGEQTASAVVSKTSYWAKSVCLGDFIADPRTHWQVMGRFMRYAWGRIYKKKDSGKGVYFTVGVDYDSKTLNYKLDCQRKTPNRNASRKIELTKQQIERFDSLVSPTDAFWNEIRIEELGQWNWQRLIETTKQFIAQHEDLYEQAIQVVYGNNVEARIARICWNTNGWRKPSGRTGKAISPSHEEEHGFGLEEWLFDPRKTMNGYQYGFLEPIRKYQTKYVGRIFNVRLFTIDANSRKWYWVGELKNVSVLNRKEASQIVDTIKLRGVFEAMRQELEDVGLTRESLTIWVDETDIINIRFKPEAMRGVLSELVEMTAKEKSEIGTRYTLFMSKIASWDEESLDRRIRGYSFEEGQTTPDTRQDKYTKYARAQSIELEYRHAPVLNALFEYLQHIHGNTEVRRECRAYGNSKIDIVQKTSSGDIFFEVKTYPDVRSNLREAIGQILEYAFYAGQDNARELIIVSEFAPRDADRRYLEKLNQKVTVPIRYMHFDVRFKKPVEIFPSL
jgi:hypothetical protein